ncbi:hypothetical protein [uncultured Desulfosarcina sp.]|uniref:hypothetical protein n=1 Tax=uncultured Desulfosarcina sp. TaxID=218289 RepID=UPI0029C8D465|nr:hypothetical protein [uncultured Desulfosarcina sp.]
MTADRSPQKNAMVSGTVMSTGALLFAALTLLFALFSLFLGNRLASLNSERIKAQDENVATETTAIEEMKSAMTGLQKDLETEKAGSKKLQNQLDAAMQELKTTRGDLAKAHQTIDALRAKSAAAVPSPPPAPQPQVPQQEAPAVTSPDTSGEADSVGTSQEEPAAQPTNAAPMPETSAPAPQPPQATIEESSIEAAPADTGGQSPPVVQQPASEASKPVVTN